MTNSNYDVMTLFRQSITAMSAGILLIIIATTSQSAIIGFTFAIYSLILIAAGFFQILPKCHKFPEAISKFSDETTILFMIVSLFSIIRNWAAIILTVNSSNKITQHGVLWVQSISSFGIAIWFIVFFLAFLTVSVFDILKNTSRTIKKVGLLRGIWFTFDMILFIFGSMGIAQFGTQKYNLILLIISIIITILSATYIIGQKSKMKAEIMSPEYNI